MPIDPRVLAAGGDFTGVARQIADLKRLLAASRVGGGSIGDGAIVSTNFGNGVINTPALVAGSITTTTLAAGAVTAITISAGAIVASKIAADAVIAGNIAADVVTAREIAAGAVSASEIATGAVTAAKISVSDLQSVAATMGTVTAGIFQTAASGARLMVGTSIVTTEGNKNGIVGLDASNNITFLIEPATGDARFTGKVLAGSSGLGNIDGLEQNSAMVISGANLATNATFDANVTGFVSFGGASIAYTTSKYYSAPGCAQVTAGGTSYSNGFNGGSLQAALPAKPYSLAIVIQTPITAPARSITMGFNFYNASSVQIGSAVTAVNTSLPGQWKKCLIENAISPAGTAFILPFYTATAVNTEVHYVDNVIFAQSTTASGSIIVANSITATEIGVSSLSAVTANMGTLTAGSITGGSIGAVTITGATVTGGTVQTASSGTRISLTSGGVTGYNSSGTQTLTIDTAGNITNFVNGSSYNGIHWYYTPNSQYAAHVSAAIGSAVTTNGTTVSSTNVGLEASGTTSNVGSLSQLLAYGSGGPGTTYLALGVMYTPSSGSYAFVRNNQNYVDLLSHDNKSGYVRGPKSTASHTTTGGYTVPGELRLWHLNVAVGVSCAAGGTQSWGFTFGGTINLGVDPAWAMPHWYVLGTGGAEYLSWTAFAMVSNGYNIAVHNNSDNHGNSTATGSAITGLWTAN